TAEGSVSDGRFRNCCRVHTASPPMSSSTTTKPWKLRSIYSGTDNLWSPTHEGRVAEEFLGDFNGVLVSDFYSAYDSISCAQQKCLIHLIRDLNEDVLKEPFNEEMRTLVHEFAELLKPIIETIDHFGLKSHFLKKHKVQVMRFYDRLSTRQYKTELARKAQERFRRNQGTLFTFLDQDDIPWNKNNTEHT